MKILAFIVSLLLLPLIAHADIKRAQQLFDEQRYGETLENINEILATSATDQQALFLKAKTLQRIGLLDIAIKTYLLIIREYPKSPEAYNNLAAIYAQQGNHKDARDALLAALNTHTSYATAHKNLGHIYSRMASKAYSKALELNDQSKPTPATLALIDSIEIQPNALAIAKSTAAKLDTAKRDEQTAAATRIAAAKREEKKAAAIRIATAKREEQKAAAIRIAAAKREEQKAAAIRIAAAKRAEQKDAAIRIAAAKREEQKAAATRIAAAKRAEQKDAAIRIAAAKQEEQNAAATRIAAAKRAEEKTVAIKLANATRTREEAAAKKHAEQKAAEIKLAAVTRAKQESTTARLRTTKLATAKPIAIHGHEVDLIISTVNDWSSAWSAQDPDAYLAYYADNFNPPKKLSKQEWKQQRRDRLRRPSFIKVSVKSPKVKLLSEHTARLTFNQDYKSNRFHSVVLKALLLKKINGSWKILKEYIPS